MKIMEKLKDLFTDVEEIEENDVISIEKVKREETKLPTVMLEEQRSNLNSIDLDGSEDKIISDRNLIVDDMSQDNKKEVDNFRFPIAFDEKDFDDEKIYSRQNVMRREQEKIKPKEPAYTPKVKKEEKVSLFKVSPVISPVYGILDKNYKKDEVQEKDIKKYTINRNSNKKIDFESVRKKAYGSLEDDIKENLSLVNDIKEDTTDDLFSSLNDLNEITIGDAEDNYFDFGVAYENAKKASKNENKKEKNEEDNNNVKILSFDKEEVKAEKIEVEEPIFDKSKQDDGISFNDAVEKENTKMSHEDMEITDDIFNLIDSMYEEKGDNND